MEPGWVSVRPACGTVLGITRNSLRHKLRALGIIIAQLCAQQMTRLKEPAYRK
jgi:hypothetical protein